MQIYTFQSTENIVMNIIYASGAIVLGVIAFALVRFFIGQVGAYRQSQQKFPKRLAAFFIAISFVPIVGVILFGNMFIKSVSYDIKMDKGNACYLEGDFELVSCEEHDYRGTFLGYDVVLELDGIIIKPSNVFSKEVVDHFKSDESLILQYGEIKNDGLYIWNISTKK